MITDMINPYITTEAQMESKGYTIVYMVRVIIGTVHAH